MTIHVIGSGRESKNLRSKDGVGDQELLEGEVRPWSCMVWVYQLWVYLYAGKFRVKTCFIPHALRINPLKQSEMIIILENDLCVAWGNVTAHSIATNNYPS